jgi:murein DD-endopeptidase MepM/ murein hydrolase activator NlpD
MIFHQQELQRMTQPISHALVLPDQNFTEWLKATDSYTKTFERVSVVRSPAGNDLNRFRNVTAVQAPGVWFKDNALEHIKRAYPMVVRVDVINVNTPAQLTQILNQRVQDKDRYGERNNTPPHIFERFVLEWPSDASPARIVRGFNAFTDGGGKNEGIDIYAPLGSKIRAAAAGTVATVVNQSTSLGYGRYVQISSRLGSLNYLLTYTQLQDIKVRVGQQVNIGDEIGASSWETIKVVVQQPGAGLAGYKLPDVVDPTPMIYWQGLRLRIREKPGTEFKIIGQLNASDSFETLEPHGRTLLKLGQEGQWLRIRSSAGVEGFVAAQYVITYAPPTVALGHINGINLDLMHPLGKPDPARLKGLGWVRMGYNVSMGRGSVDFNAAYNLYAPYLQRCAQQGLKVMLVLTHQTYGEGQGYYWPGMTPDKWQQLTKDFANVCREVANRFKGRNMVHAYQIWNEQDAPPNAGSSVPIPAKEYANLLAESIKAIRSVDPTVKIITGGHTGGPGPGAVYARDTINNLPAGVRPDGIASHPYGRGADPKSPYAIFGHIDDEINAFSKIIPGAPVWLTEWGVLDRPQDSVDSVNRYASEFLNQIKRKHSGRVASVIWYAWADSMHNGYGLVGKNDQPKQPLYNTYVQWK